MNEYVIATDDVTKLMKELAANVIEEVETKLVVTNGRLTKHIWFTPQEVSSMGFTGGQVLHGRSGLIEGSSSRGTPAFIQIEEKLLIINTDL